MIDNKTGITCDVCMDLIPLVIDGVASNDSKNLVLSHIEQCSDCQVLYNNLIKPEPDKTNDTRNLHQIKKRLYSCGVLLLILGAFAGIYLSNSMGMFYNFLLMPLVGFIGYHLLHKKWYLVPIGVFLFSYSWLFAGYIIQYKKITTEMFTYPMLLTPIYFLLTLVGVLVGALLKFAFKKEIK